MPKVARTERTPAMVMARLLSCGLGGSCCSDTGTPRIIGAANKATFYARSIASGLAPAPSCGLRTIAVETKLLRDAGLDAGHRHGRILPASWLIDHSSKRWAGCNVRK